MAGSSLNIQQGRDFIFYDQAYAAANALPTPAAWNTPWGASWRDVGYSDGGIGFNIGTTYEDVLVDQEIDAVGVIPTGRDIRMTAQLAEFTITNLQASIGQGSVSTVAAGAGTRGYQDLAIANTIAVNYRTVGASINRSLGDSEAIQLAIWRGQCRSAVATSFVANAKAIIPFEVQAFPDPNNANRVMTIRDISAAL
jgi:hypothetical protein